MRVNELSNQLKAVLKDSHTQLLEIDEKMASPKPNPDKWSKKEIIGHLIDSASNNHQRFVRVQFKDDLIFEGYVQDDWVKVQDYQGRRWSDLVEVWYSYNNHLVDVIANIPTSVLELERAKHNLHKIAFKTIPQKQPTTLDYFISDYIVHLEHHLMQILD